MGLFSQDAALILALTLAFDLIIGEPPSRLHPVVWMGSVIKLVFARAPRQGRKRQLGYGALAALALPAAAAASAVALASLDLPHYLLVGLSAFLLKSSFALGGLGKAAEQVRTPLMRGDLCEARRGLSHLCSRDSHDLSAEEVAGAAIESIAENTGDSFVAPVFYFLLFGLPGALAYRCLNTLDSTVGYRDRYEYLGKVSARLDDLANLIPARVSALLFLLVSPLHDADGKQGVRIWRRDRARTASPNAGHPMAMMAGLLGLCLEKRQDYRLGDATRPADPERIDQAWSIASMAMALFAFGAIGGCLVA